MSPVLYQEMLLGARRNRQYVVRWIYAGLLVFELAIFLLGYLINLSGGMGVRRLPTFTEFASQSRFFVDFFTTQHFILILLVTPTVTAGAITDEKSRGTLQYLLTADLQPGEIILGKMIGRNFQVALLTLTGLPLLCFFGVYAGLDVVKLLAFVAATFVMIFALGAASLLASVLCRHTRDAVLSLYSAALGVFVLSLVVSGVLELTRGVGPNSSPAWLRTVASILETFNPLAPLGADWLVANPGDIGRRLLMLLASWGTFGCVCLLVAVLRLRGAYLRYLQGGEPKKARWWRARRAALGNDPLAWKERHVEGIAPLAVLRGLPRWLGLVLVFVITVLWAGFLLLRHLPFNESLLTLARRVSEADWAGLLTLVQGLPHASVANDFYWYFGLPVMLVAGLVIGIRCSGAVTGEREKQTWEALLLTPLETSQLIRGKFWGIIGATWPYLVAYAVPALLVSAVGGVGAFLWTLLWLGVTLLAMAFVGAAGLWCSVRSSSSWRSLLGTLAFAYGGGSLLFCVASPLVFIIALFISFALMLFDHFMGTAMAMGFSRFGHGFNIASCLTLAAIFVVLAWRLVISAEYRVGILERTKHWKHEPRSRSRSRSIVRSLRYEEEDDDD